MDLGWGQVAAGQTCIRYQLFKPDAYPSPIIWSVPWQVRCDNNTAGAGPNSSPLTRLTDEGLQELNRTFACLDSYPRPPGKSRDEYPFASTWQGAYTSGSTTAARTRDWCQVAEPILSGPYGWSVCMVDEWQNSAGGSALGAWYLANRVISGDQC